VLRTGSSNAWVVHLMTTLPNRGEDIQLFLDSVAAQVPIDSLHAYAWERDGRQGMSTFQGPFGSRREAEAALAALPEAAKRLQPWLRQLGSLQREATIEGR
jgi:septal ring-binding cell division protein DamX